MAIPTKPNKGPRDGENPTAPRRANSWERANVIVYDASSQRLTREDRKEAEKNASKHTCVKIPPRPRNSLEDRVRLSVPIGAKSRFEFLAEVKLNSLGTKVIYERWCGNIDEIWIKGVPSFGR